MIYRLSCTLAVRGGDLGAAVDDPSKLLDGGDRAAMSPKRNQKYLAKCTFLVFPAACAHTVSSVVFIGGLVIKLQY